MSKQLIERLRGFKDTPRTADNLCHEAADRIEELERANQHLIMALADTEALELGTAERCDQLRAQINVLREAATPFTSPDVVDETSGTIPLMDALEKAISSTPEQSLAEYRNKVIEECAAVLNVAITRLSSCGASIKNDVAISTLKEQSCRLRAMKEKP